MVLPMVFYRLTLNRNQCFSNIISSSAEMPTNVLFHNPSEFKIKTEKQETMLLACHFVCYRIGLNELQELYWFISYSSHVFISCSPLLVGFFDCMAPFKSNKSILSLPHVKSLRGLSAFLFVCLFHVTKFDISHAFHLFSGWLFEGIFFCRTSSYRITPTLQHNNKKSQINLFLSFSFLYFLFTS